MTARRRSAGGLVAGLWLALLASTALQGPALATSLEEAVQRAVLNNPDVGSAASDRRAADEQVRQARAGYFPRADIRTAIGREWANTPSTRAGSPPWEDDSTNKNRTDTSLTVRQMLFDGFETESDVARRQALAESSASRVRRGYRATAGQKRHIGSRHGAPSPGSSNASCSRLPSSETKLPFLPRARSGATGSARFSARSFGRTGQRRPRSCSSSEASPGRPPA